MLGYFGSNHSTHDWREALCPIPVWLDRPKGLPGESDPPPGEALGADPLCERGGGGRGKWPQAIADALVGAVRAFLSLGPLPVLALVVALVWWACSRIVRLAESEARRRPLFVAWLLWRWSRRRR